MITAPEVSAPEHPSVFFYLNCFHTHLFKKPVSSEVHGCDGQRKTLPLRNLDSIYTVTETGRTQSGKDPYRAQENHEANQGSLRNKNHECVFSSFSHLATHKSLTSS